MAQDLRRDIISIREWLVKETYLPQDFDELMIKKFLHSCYGSLEKTKKCIERFCCTRSEMPEVYTSRDPLSPNIQTAFSITCVATYEAGEDEILIHQVDDPSLDSYVFYDVLKAFAIQADYWLQFNDVFPQGHIIVLDIKDYSLKIIPKVNVLFFRNFLLYLLEGMPVRVKEVHVVNCPSYYDKLYALVKPVLPADIRNTIKFHSNAESLQKCIDKKYLPEEYGGDAGSMKRQHREWVKQIQENKDLVLDDDKWKADMQTKAKRGFENAMSGSFRTLSID